MPRAAPGKDARVAVRRKLPEYLEVPVHLSDRHLSKCPYSPGMEYLLYPNESCSKKCRSFTQQLSVIGVGRGRLGEVVSQVGDCRPPPPDNPHRPIFGKKQSHEDGVNLAQDQAGGAGFWSMIQKTGGIICPVCVRSSFNNNKITANLKDLNPTEYFKKECSYFSCAVNILVLKFYNFHSHLCGLKVVKPPSIVMTNVLEM